MKLTDKEKNALFEELGVEWRNSCLVSQTPIYGDSGKIRLPKVWMDTLAMKDVTFYSMLPHDAIEQITKNLPPMSDRLKKICDKLHLPTWSSSSKKEDLSN
jgi:hypothetical protein